MALNIEIDEIDVLSDLAWSLYQDGFRVARLSPELQQLLGEVSVLAHSTKILKEDVKDPGSVLVQAGEERIRSVNGLLAEIKITLSEVEKIFEGRESFLDGTNAKKRSLWAKLKSSTGFSTAYSVRRKVSRLLFACSIIAANP
jgi:hypothetical protein